MAKGTMVSESVYYNDDATYTGDPGSETNRFVVEDAYDFCNMRIGSRCYVLVKDINMSEYPEYKFGISSSISDGYIYLYGNNHKIQNLFIKDATHKYVFTAWGIYDTIFENLILMNCSASGTSMFDRNIGLYNCKFGVFFVNSSMSFLFNNITVSDCTFNLRGITLDGVRATNDDNAANAHEFIRTHINLDITTPATYSGVALGNFNLDNSYITGNINIPNFHKGFVQLNLQQSYISVNITTENPSSFTVEHTTSASSFINKSNLQSEIIDTLTDAAIDGLYILDEAQCKDPQYLLSIGFPVVPIAGDNEVI